LSNVDADVLVIGAGLAGLSAAIRVAIGGASVLVIERLPVAGGLCGSWSDGEFTFVRACNDFSGRLVRELRRLDVKLEFTRSRWHLAIGERGFDFPPRIRDLPLVGRVLPDLWRARQLVRKGAAENVGELVTQSDRSGLLTGFTGLMLAVAGASPWAVQLADLRDDEGYELHRWYHPRGGPQALSDAMVARAQALGVRLELGRAAARPQLDSRERIVIATNAGDLRARAVISSAPQPAARDEASKFALAQLHLAVDPRAPLPSHDLFTTVPSGSLEWFRVLERGVLPDAFGFHLYRSELPGPRDRWPHRAMTCSFTVPSALARFDRDTAARIEAYLLERVEALIPGLRAALLHTRLLAPSDFQRLHGSSSTTPPPTRVGLRKPASFDASTGVHHVGNGFLPAGEHAAQAVLSGRRAAEAVLERLTKQELAE
jgi:phytoene dehydrogenase-like protein